MDSARRWPSHPCLTHFLLVHVTLQAESGQWLHPEQVTQNGAQPSLSEWDVGDGERAMPGIRAWKRHRARQLVSLLSFLLEWIWRSQPSNPSVHPRNLPAPWGPPHSPVHLWRLPLDFGARLHHLFGNFTAAKDRNTVSVHRHSEQKGRGAHTFFFFFFLTSQWSDPALGIRAFSSTRGHYYRV